MEPMYEKIRVDLEAEQARLLESAEKLATQFWDEHYAHGKDPKTRGRLGLRVRKLTVGVAADWFVASFFRRKDGTNGVKFDYVQRNGKTRCTERMFRGVRPWEKALALEMEETLGFVRAQSDALVRVAKMVQAIDRRRANFEEQRIEQ